MGPGGEIGRHAGLKILFPAMGVRVQVPPGARNTADLTGSAFLFTTTILQHLMAQPGLSCSFLIFIIG